MSNTTPMIGILAGMGPRSTAPFIDQVLTECQRQYGARDDIDFPKLMICSQPAPFYEDRPPDHAALEAATLEGLRDLERAGASFLAIACNTVHIYHARLAAAVRVPLLNMVTTAVDALPSDVERVALVAARPTVEAGIYQDALRRRGIAVASVDWQHEVDALLGEIRAAPSASSLQRAWDGVIRRVEAARADLVLVACLDLSGVLPHARTSLRIVDAAQALAEAIVARYLALRASSTRASAAFDGV